MLDLHIREQAPWKSVAGIGDAVLPGFTVLAGLNGAGKTHLLEALDNGRIQAVIDGEPIEEDAVSLYNWTTLAMSDPGEATSWQIDQRVYSIWQQVKSQRESGRAAQVFRQEQERLQLGLTASQLLEQPVTDLPIDEAKQRDVTALRKSVRQSILESIGTNRQTVEAVEVATSKSIFEIDQPQFLATSSLLSREESPLKQQIHQTFLAYEKLRFRNESFRLRAEAGNPESEFLTDDDFVHQYGPPPWVVLNGLLADRGLDLTVDEPAIGAQSYSVTLRHRESDAEIPLTHLSSGETILVSLAMSVYGLRDQRHGMHLPRMMLLDEVDAPLHPAMTRTFLHMLQDLLIANGVAVIATTHNPSTVALAPPDSVVWMARGAPRLTPVPRAQALAHLTSGISALTFRFDERRVVLTESGSDSDVYTVILDALQPLFVSNYGLAFVPATREAGVGGASIVRRNVEMLREAGADTIFGVIDRDTGNEPSSDGSVVVMGPSGRYTLENYIFDPLLIAALLVREKLDSHVPGLVNAVGNGPGTWRGIDRADSERLQAIADVTISALGDESGGNDATVQCHLVGGQSILMPPWLIDDPGHQLFDRWTRAIPQLQRFQTEEKLRRAVLNLVVADVPTLLSRDFLDLMMTLAES